MGELIFKDSSLFLTLFHKWLLSVDVCKERILFIDFFLILNMQDLCECAHVYLFCTAFVFRHTNYLVSVNQTSVKISVQL